MPDFSTYQSPFSWRYGSVEMRALWSEYYKRIVWRRLWVALAEVQAEFDLVSPEQVADLRAHMEHIDMERVMQIEAHLKHDLMAEIRAFGEQCKIGAGIIHLGATSMDIKDNADIIRIRESIDLLLSRFVGVLQILCDKVEEWADMPVMAFTHLQPAEPSTLGYRLASCAQDLFTDWIGLSQLRDDIRGKGFKGSVGTMASYGELIGLDNLDRFEEQLSRNLNLEFFPVTSQVYPRKQDYQIASALAGLGATLYKFGFDLRILQSPPIGELSEPFGSQQVGSSAMPFKRNPIQSEKMDSLARMLAQYPRIAWDNAAHSLLENTLDDSANRRTYIPEMFLICDELLITFFNILEGLQVNVFSILRNLGVYAPFAATERVLLAACKEGADRQVLHERLRMHSLAAWKSVQKGEENPLEEYLKEDPDITCYVELQHLSQLMNVRQHLGNAPERARKIANQIKQAIQVIN